MNSLRKAQIKVIKHKFFEGIEDKNKTVRPMPASEAREVLESLGYKLVKERTEHGAVVEIWELPEDRQTK